MRKVLFFLLLVVVVAGCTVNTPTPPPPTDVPTDVPTATNTIPAPTEKPTVTVAPPSKTPPPVFTLITVQAPPTATEVPADFVADIPNPSFEGEWREVPYRGQVPVGWYPWGLEGTPAEDGRITIIAEWKRNCGVANRSSDGACAVQFFRTWEVNDGGVYSSFYVPEGYSTCTFSVDASAWSAEELADVIYANNRKLREQYTGHGLWDVIDGKYVWGPLYSSDIWKEDNLKNITFNIGTAPSYTEPTSPDVIWSEPFRALPLAGQYEYTILDRFTKLVAELPVVPGYNMIFLRGANRWGTSHNDKYLDNVQVVCN